jgi:hypothetical protein
MRPLGINFAESAATERSGTVAVFEDLCGNRWDRRQSTA